MKIEHIANLAKLELEDNYQSEIEEFLTEIKEITELEVDKDIMISSSFNQDVFFNDITGTHINREQAFKNSKMKDGDYIVVPKVVE